MRLLRAEARAGACSARQIADSQARGDLVPDQIVLDVLTPAIVEAAAAGGYLLDGFPRTQSPDSVTAGIQDRLSELPGLRGR